MESHRDNQDFYTEVDPSEFPFPEEESGIWLQSETKASKDEALEVDIEIEIEEDTPNDDKVEVREAMDYNVHTRPTREFLVPALDGFVRLSTSQLLDPIGER